MEYLEQMLKIAEDVSETDKAAGRQCLKLFESFVTMLHHTEEMIDMMYTPFKDGGNISPEALDKAKAAIFRFKQKIKSKYENVKYLALHSIAQFLYFDSDMMAHEMNESFKEMFEDLESVVKDLLDQMDDLDDADFQSKFINFVETLKAQHESITELVEDRLVDWLSSNVLETNWFDKSKNLYNIELNKKIPSVVKLYEQQNTNDKDLRGNVRQQEIPITPPQKAERDEVRALNEGK